jgi:hypothetical protein
MVCGHVFLLSNKYLLPSFGIPGSPGAVAASPGHTSPPPVVFSGKYFMFYVSLKSIDFNDATINSVPHSLPSFHLHA